MNILFLCVIAYLFGSILFGNIVAGILKIGDLTKQGSGNIGATNITRVSGNKRLGFLVAVLDALKGVIPVLIAKSFTTSEFELSVIGALAILGHIFPIWHRFKGGKGIATFIGVNLALNLQIGCVLSLIWIGVFGRWRTSSLASIGMIIASVLIYVLYSSLQSLPIIVISLLILLKHKDNIGRIMNGSEQSFKK